MDVQKMAIYLASLNTSGNGVEHNLVEVHELGKGSKMGRDHAILAKRLLVRTASDQEGKSPAEITARRLGIEILLELDAELGNGRVEGIGFLDGAHVCETMVSELDMV